MIPWTVDGSLLARAVPPLVMALALNALAVLPMGPLRAAVTVPLVLLLPGVAVNRWLPSATEVTGLGTPFQAMVISLAVYPLLAVMVQWNGQAITKASLLAATDLFVAVVTLAGGATYLWRHRRSTGTRSGASRLPRRTPPLPVRPVGEPYTEGDILLKAAYLMRRIGRLPGSQLPILVCTWGMVLGGLAGTIWLVQQRVPGAPADAYTRLALAGGWAVSQGVVHSSSAQITITLAVANHTPRARTFQILARFDGLEPWPVVRAGVGAYGHWEGVVSGVQLLDGTQRRLTIQLMDAGHIVVPPLVLWFRPSPRLVLPAIAPPNLPRCPADDRNPLRPDRGPLPALRHDRKPEAATAYQGARTSGTRR